MSERKIVRVPMLRTGLVRESDGFVKKHLSDFKIDLLALCEFGCRYCSSNTGNYLRINRPRFADLTRAQLGERILPSEDPKLRFACEGDVSAQLDRELSARSKSWGTGKTLVFSMLTDGFSPWLVSEGFTRAALDLLVERTSFRIRVLTKNAVVGHSEWIEYFLRHQPRFVVGLSTGSLDTEWARAVEIGTSSPRARLASLRALQDAGVTTYGMMCPIFPDVIAGRGLDELIDAIRPARTETIWAEPYNDRANWSDVRSGYREGSPGWEWFTRVYERGDQAEWSRYATDLYVALKLRAEAEGGLPKLKYLLYEHGIVAEHARSYCDPRGLMLQSPASPEGFSHNPHIRAVQEQIGRPSVWDRVASDHSILEPALRSLPTRVLDVFEDGEWKPLLPLEKTS